METKVYLVGIDQLMYPITKSLVGKGLAPNLGRLISRGSANQSISSFPAWTPTNWATIATGTDAGTHGVFNWRVDTPGGKSISSFHSNAIKSETIWEAAERQGLRCAIVHYPASMPSRLRRSFIVDGDASPGFGESRYEITPSRCYTTLRNVPGAERIEVRPARGWKNLPPSQSAPLEATMRIITKYGGDEKEFQLLFTSSAGGGYDAAHLCIERNGDSTLAVSKIGAWSGWVKVPFKVDGRGRKGTFRLKLISGSGDPKHIRLYRSQVMPTSGFTSPDDLGEELVERIGPYQEHVSEVPSLAGATDFETCVEEAEYQSDWFIRAAKFLMDEKRCQLFYCHWHFLDDINHHHLANVDPTWKYYDPHDAKRNWRIIERGYRVVDGMIGGFLRLLDRESSLVVTADHGNQPVNRLVFMERFLKDQKLLKVKDETKPLSVYDENWESNIDWRKTKVYLKKGSYIDNSFYINSKGNDREKIADDLILRLRTWVDEETGKTPVAIALKKKDAAIIGCWGEDIGDVVCVLESGYASYTLPHKSSVGSKTIEDLSAGIIHAHHGPQLATAQSDVSSHMAMTIFLGPKVKRGYERPPDKLGYMNTKDIVPTICHILGILPPKHTRGAVAYDIFRGNEPPAKRAPSDAEDRPVDPRLWVQQGMYDLRLIEGGEN